MLARLFHLNRKFQILVVTLEIYNEDFSHQKSCHTLFYTPLTIQGFTVSALFINWSCIMSPKINLVTLCLSVFTN